MEDNETPDPLAVAEAVVIIEGAKVSLSNLSESINELAKIDPDLAAQQAIEVFIRLRDTMISGGISEEEADSVVRMMFGLNEEND